MAKPPIVHKAYKHKGYATVICEGTLHNISVIGKKLVFHGHPGQSVTRMIAMNKIGSECRCAEVAEIWRKRDVEHLPANLRDKRPLPRTRIRPVFETKIPDVTDLLRLANRSVPLVQDQELVLKIAKLVGGIAKRVLNFSQAKYLKTQNIVVVGVVKDPDAAGIYNLHYGDVENWPNGYAVGYKVLVAADWIERVYDQGLAELRDNKKRRHLTLRLLNRGTSPVLHVVRSAGGFCMRQTHANVVERDGKKILNILTEK